MNSFEKEIISKVKMKKFVGVADCHGLESFIPIKEAQSFALKMRADCNRQRHAIFYQVEVTEEQEKKIKQHIINSSFKKAFRYIKKYTILKVPATHIHSLSLIPNDKLDPYG